MNRRALLAGFLALPVAARFERPRPMTDAERAELVALFLAWHERQLQAGLAAMLGVYREEASLSMKQFLDAAGEAMRATSWPWKEGAPTCDSFVAARKR